MKGLFLGTKQFKRYEKQDTMTDKEKNIFSARLPVGVREAILTWTSS